MRRIPELTALGKAQATKDDSLGISWDSLGFLGIPWRLLRDDLFRVRSSVPTIMLEMTR